jgi:hypothetical protein
MLAQAGTGGPVDRSRLVVLLSLTTLLVACGESNDSDSSARDADAATQTDADAANPFADLPLAPIPDGGLSCPPDDVPSEFGPCCYKVLCYAPTSGGCKAANGVGGLSLNEVNLYHSGACQCDRSGPYSRQGVEDIALGAGECCYIVGSRRCI